MALATLLGAKFDTTDEEIQRDLKDLEPAIQLRLKDQGWIVERLIAENPWDPVYANISVALGWNMTFGGGQDMPPDQYTGIAGLSVAVSHNDLSDYSPGPPLGRPYNVTHIDQLLFSVPIELPEVVTEESREPGVWDNVLQKLTGEPEEEPEEELPPPGMRLPD